MNLHDFILDGGLADTDPGVIAERYIRAVLALEDQSGQVAALEPSVRPHASRLSSAVRRAIRSPGGGPPARLRSALSSGPAQSSDDTQPGHGGPAQERDDSHSGYGGPLPAWAAQHAGLIAYCRAHQDDHFYIPGSGRRKLAEITADEWLARARWLTQQSEGTAKAAEFSRSFAVLTQAAGVATVGEALEILS